MRIQPQHHDNELKAHHALFVGSTGSGKTSAIKKLGFIKPTDQVVLYDPYKDYDRLCNREVRRYDTIASFARALYQARSARNGQGFKIAFSPKEGANQKTLEDFSEVVWGAGDARKKPLKIVFEELAKCVKTNAKATGAFGEILTGGRKYSLQALCLFQRGQEVPKTIFGQTPVKWVGRQERKKDALYLSDELDLPANEIMDLECLEYLIKDTNKHKMGNYDKGKIRF